MDYKKLIKKCINKGDYEKSNVYINEYMSELTYKSQQDLIFCYYYLSYNYLKLENYLNCLENNLFALNLSIRDEKMIIKIYWIKAICLKKMNVKEQALMCYQEIANYYIRMGNEKMYLHVQFEIAKTHSNLDEMKNILIKYLKSYLYKDLEILYDECECEQEVIKELYLEAIKMHVCA